MCRPASFVVTKKKVFWSETSDSHEDIIEEFGLKEFDVRKKATFVRVEITPPNQDFRLPLKKWRFQTDQDLLPDWYDSKEAEKRIRKILPKWLKRKVVLPKEERKTVDARGIIAIYGKVKYIYGSAQVEYICGSAQVKYISGSAQVEYIYGSAQVKNICGSAQVKYISGSAQVGNICDSAQVKNIYDSAQVKRVEGKAVIASHNNLSPKVLKSSQAVLIDRTKDPVVCYVGKKQ